MDSKGTELLREISKCAMEETDLKIEIYLDEKNLKDLETVEEQVRIVEWSGKDEFGFEAGPGDKIIINCGCAVTQVDREVFMRQYRRWITREQHLEKLRQL